MKRFDTPRTVAQALANHAPRKLDVVLDPAVGSGALLEPLVRRFGRNKTRTFCIDTDVTVLSELKKNANFGTDFEIVCIKDDFIRWAESYVGPSFDCVFMNPPFSGRKSKLRRILVPGWLEGEEPTFRFMPLEASFLCVAHRLLRDGGRLLAVLPCSIVMSESLQWLREFLVNTGAIRFVHELPARSFPGVESRMYLLVYDRGKRQGTVRLYNHDIQRPVKLGVDARSVRATHRLDFGYHDAVNRRASLLTLDELNWGRLEDIATVFRGDVPSPNRNSDTIHTSNYKDGFWHPSEIEELGSTKDGVRMVVAGDILVKRIGRDCYRSFGLHLSNRSFRCSDCILIVRPKDSEFSEKLLFALNVLSECRWMRPLLERGTGASYITTESLNSLLIPAELWKVYGPEFNLFRSGLQSRSDWGIKCCTRTVANNWENLAIDSMA